MPVAELELEQAELISQPSFSIQPITFPVVEARIAELAKKYDALTIKGINDKTGLSAVHEARMEVRDYRLKVERKRVELKKDSLEYGRKVDSEAKRLTELLEPIELRLENKEKAIAAEKDRLKNAADDAKRAIVQARVDALVALGGGVYFVIDPIAVGGWTEPAYQEAVAKATADKAEREKAAEVERQRLAAEAEARRIEAVKLAVERAELDKQRREQEAESARLKAEADKIAFQASEQRRAIELENAKREAAEKSRVETEQRIAAEQARAKQEAEAKAAREKADADAREAARIEEEAKMPQRKKLQAVADVIEAVPVPDGVGSLEVKAVIADCAEAIRQIAKGPLRKKR